VNDPVLFEISFPFMCDVFAAIVRTKGNEFSSGLAFNFHMPDLEGSEGFTFSAKEVDPSVASGVISKGDHVIFSTKRHNRCGAPEIGVN